MRTLGLRPSSIRPANLKQADFDRGFSREAPTTSASPAQASRYLAASGLVCTRQCTLGFGRLASTSPAHDKTALIGVSLACEQGPPGVDGPCPKRGERRRRSCSQPGGIARRPAFGRQDYATRRESTRGRPAALAGAATGPWSAAAEKAAALVSGASLAAPLVVQPHKKGAKDSTVIAAQMSTVDFFMMSDPFCSSASRVSPAPRARQVLPACHYGREHALERPEQASVAAETNT